VSATSGVLYYVRIVVVQLLLLCAELKYARQGVFCQDPSCLRAFHVGWTLTCAYIKFPQPGQNYSGLSDVSIRGSIVEVHWTSHSHFVPWNEPVNGWKLSIIFHPLEDLKSMTVYHSKHWTRDYVPWTEMVDKDQTNQPISDTSKRSINSTKFWWLPIECPIIEPNRFTNNLSCRIVMVRWWSWFAGYSSRERELPSLVPASYGRWSKMVLRSSTVVCITGTGILYGVSATVDRRSWQRSLDAASKGPTGTSEFP
jgi:hypothetical protein